MENMIVCTCDVCGQETETWSTLIINLGADNYKKEICPNCKLKISNAIKNFIHDEFIDTEEKK